MKFPPDLEDSEDDEVPREITRENFGNTFTKFAPPNTTEKNEKSAKNTPKNSSLKNPIYLKTASRESAAEGTPKTGVNDKSAMEFSGNSPYPPSQSPNSPDVKRPTFLELKD